MTYFNPLKDTEDLTGRVAIVTGGKCVAQAMHKEHFEYKRTLF